MAVIGWSETDERKTALAVFFGCLLACVVVFSKFDEGLVQVMSQSAFIPLGYRCDIRLFKGIFQSCMTETHSGIVTLNHEYDSTQIGRVEVDFAYLLASQVATTPRTHGIGSLLVVLVVLNPPLARLWLHSCPCQF